MRALALRAAVAASLSVVAWSSTGCSKIAALVDRFGRDAGDPATTMASAADAGAGVGAGVGVGLAGATPPTTDLVTVRDPVENAFSMDMPKGWANRAYSARVFNVHNMVTTSISPDGSVLLYSGDPSIPSHINPATAAPLHRDMAKKHPAMKLEPFTPAEVYFPAYVQRKFGRLPSFKLVSTEPDTVMAGRLAEKFAAAGVSMKPTAANVTFTYDDGGKPMNALILGTTSDSGAFWVVTVTGITTTADPKQYLPMVEAMSRAHRMNPEWQAAEQRKHQAQMAQIEAFGRQLTAQHQRNMAAIQQSAQAHQQRMNALWSANDTSMKSFNDRMASGDKQHRSFLNYINEENTVVTSSGATYQVDGSYQRYFMNKQSHTYVGGDATMGIDDLREMGLNPGDYEEVTIKP